MKQLADFRGDRNAPGATGKTLGACLLGGALLVLWSGASWATGLYEDWEGGAIDPADWVIWEENSSQADPQVISGQGYGGTYGLNVGGATTYFAGVYSTQSFDLGAAPLVFSAQLRATQSLSSGQVLSFGIREGDTGPWTAQIGINACLPTGDPTVE